VPSLDPKTPPRFDFLRHHGKLVFLGVLGLLLTACGGSSSPPTLQGYVINGPLAGALVHVLSPAGEHIAESTTDDDGHFKVEVEQDPPYRIRTSGGYLDGTLYGGSLLAWCESRKDCMATPLTTVLVRLMDAHGFSAADARSYLSSRIGFSGDPFTDPGITAEQFLLDDARATINGGHGLDAWVSSFVLWLLDSTRPRPAGLPIPAFHPVTTHAGAGGSINPVSAMVGHGSSMIFTIIPDPGYGIASVTGCSGSLAGTSYTTGAIIRDCIVTASFVLLTAPQDVEATAGDSGITISWSAVDGAIGYNVYWSEVPGIHPDTAGSYSGVDIGVTSPHVVTGLTNGTAYHLIVTATAGGNESAPSTEVSAIPDAPVQNVATGVLNDTGATLCGDYAYDSGSGSHQNNLDCAAAGAIISASGIDSEGDPVPAAQDAHYGRDVTDHDPGDGRAGFSYTKIANTGLPLEDQTVAYATTPWSCVLDNVTGLLWEVKTDDGGLQDKDWTYTWFNADMLANGGEAGEPNGGNCHDPYDANSNPEGQPCDTAGYVAAVNAAGLCGHHDWRLPTRKELISLVDNSVASPGPTVDSNWFPNTQGSRFWTSSPYAYNTTLAWHVYFGDGNVAAHFKFLTYRVRLVRAVQ